MHSRHSLWLLSFYPSIKPDIYALNLHLYFHGNNKEKSERAKQVVRYLYFISPSPLVNNFLDKGFILFMRILTKINMVYYAYPPMEC